MYSHSLMLTFYINVRTSVRVSVKLDGPLGFIDNNWIPMYIDMFLNFVFKTFIHQLEGAIHVILVALAHLIAALDH